MLILLPPSEGKSTPPAGDPVDLGSLAFAEQLGKRRGALLDALERLPGVPAKRALEMLDISKGQAGEVAIDAGVARSPPRPPPRSTPASSTSGLACRHCLRGRGARY